MAGSDFIDPFDKAVPHSVRAKAAAPPAASSGFVDPFDKPGYGQTELRSAPAGTRVPSEIVQDRTDKGANFGSALFSSLPPDDSGKIQMLSKAMGIPVQRFGVMRGDIVYVGDDGKTYKAIPSVSGATGVGDFAQRAATAVASEVGPNMAGLVGGVAGIATAPFLGGVPGATVAAGATDTARQAAANAMLGRDGIDWLNVGGQAAMAGAGQTLSAGAGALLSRNSMKIAPYDRQRAIDPATLAGARAAQSDAVNAGMEPLTFGQATGLRSALSSERQLARDPVSMDTMDAKYGRQRASITRGVNDFLDTNVSPVTSPEQGAKMLREGANSTIESAVARRRALSRPDYDAAMKLDVGAGYLGAATADVPLLGGILKTLRASDVYAPEIGQMPDSSLKVLDLAKRKMDDMFEEATKAGRKNEARLIDDQRKKLVGLLDQATTDPQTGVSVYADARSKFAGASPEVDALTNGPVGIVAGRESSPVARDAGTLFDFRRIGPQATREARLAFEKAGMTDQWNAGVRAHIQNMFAEADGSAQKFINRVWGNERDPRQREILQSALSPAQFQGFERLMRVLENYAKTLPEGSPTATDAVGGKALRDQFGGAARMLGRFLSPSRALDMGGAATDAVSLRLSDAGMIRLAEAVTDPDNLRALQRLRMMNPKSAAAASAAAQILVGAGVSSSGARTPNDFDPPALSGTR